MKKEKQNNKENEIPEELKQKEIPRVDNPPPYQDNNPFRPILNKTNPFRVGLYPVKNVYNLLLKGEIKLEPIVGKI